MEIDIWKFVRKLAEKLKELNSFAKEEYLRMLISWHFRTLFTHFFTYINCLLISQTWDYVIRYMFELYIYI